MRTPKQRFIDSAAKKEFAELVQKPEFEEALYSAMLQFQFEAPEPVDPNHGWHIASQMAGVRRFVEILSSLHLPEPTRQKPIIPSLKLPS